MAVLDHTVTLRVPAVEADASGREAKEARQYRVVGMGPLVRAHFVNLLKERAWNELIKQAAFLPMARLNRLEASIFRDMAAGKFEWGDDVYESMQGSQTYFELELLARLKATNPDLTKDDVDRLVETYGWDKLVRSMMQADGPQLPKVPPPTPGGGESMTNDSSGQSSNGTPAKTPNESAPSPTA